MAGDSSFLRPAIVVAVLRHPSLWVTAVRQVFRLAPQGWWRRAPFLPVPRADYMEFRLVTQYGGTLSSASNSIRAVDVVDYLSWCKQWDKQA